MYAETRFIHSKHFPDPWRISSLVDYYGVLFDPILYYAIEALDHDAQIADLDNSMSEPNSPSNLAINTVHSRIHSIIFRIALAKVRKHLINTI